MTIVQKKNLGNGIPVYFVLVNVSRVKNRKTPYNASTISRSVLKTVFVLETLLAIFCLSSNTHLLLGSHGFKQK